MQKKFLTHAIIVFVSFLLLSGNAISLEYHVSINGDDKNPGTYENPLRTFKAVEKKLLPGDTLFIHKGIYDEPLKIFRNGTSRFPITIQGLSGAILDAKMENGRPIYVAGSNIIIEGIEIRNSKDICADIAGNNIILRKLFVRGCMVHGIQMGGKNIILSDSEISMTNLQNRGKNTSWGSALKVRQPGRDIIIFNNRIYENYGEGIGITKAMGVRIIKNTVSDSYSVNIYIDNSEKITAEKNFVYCTQNKEFYRDNYPASGIALGEEYYEGWGARLSDITVKNNIVSFCRRGFAYFGADKRLKGGMDNVKVVHNTFYGIKDTVLVLEYEPAKTKNVLIGNNIFHQEEKKFAWVENKGWPVFFSNYYIGSLPPEWMGINGEGDKTGENPFRHEPGYSPYSYALKDSPAKGSARKLSYAWDDFFCQQRYFFDMEANIGAVE